MIVFDQDQGPSGSTSSLWQRPEATVWRRIKTGRCIARLRWQLGSYTCNNSRTNLWFWVNSFLLSLFFLIEPVVTCLVGNALQWSVLQPVSYEESQAGRFEGTSGPSGTTPARAGLLRAGALGHVQAALEHLQGGPWVLVDAPYLLCFEKQKRADVYLSFPSHAWFPCPPTPVVFYNLKSSTLCTISSAEVIPDLCSHRLPLELLLVLSLTFDVRRLELCVLLNRWAHLALYSGLIAWLMLGLT